MRNDKPSQTSRKTDTHLTGGHHMPRFVMLISAAIVTVFVGTSRASTLYTTEFPDLAGWTTFATPAAASTDPLDGRTVYVNGDPTSGATSYVQRTLASDMPFGPYTKLESTIRRTSS